jgi:GNAT superfamily N-acetyltransferase
MEKEFGDFRITDDRSQLDLDRVQHFLEKSYWAYDRSKEQNKQAFENSICISVFAAETQIGFARVVTDTFTFSWIADVIVDPNYRSQGIGKEIMTFIQDHPGIPKSRQMLRTKDAHGLYEQFGFRRDQCMIK